MAFRQVNQRCTVSRETTNIPRGAGHGAAPLEQPGDQHDGQAGREQPDRALITQSGRPSWFARKYTTPSTATAATANMHAHADRMAVPSAASVPPEIAGRAGWASCRRSACRGLQCGQQFLGGLPAIGGALLQAAHHDRVERRRDRGPAAGAPARAPG